MDPNTDREKLKALVQYICAKGEPALLGATKLNKILFFSDFSAYRNTGRAITGAKYIKHQYGPVATDYDAILEELQQEGKIVVRDDLSGKFAKKEYIALQRADLSRFTADDISLVDEWIDEICRNRTAKEISEISHQLLPWKLAEMGEVIPYFMAYGFKLGEIKPSDIEWARQQVAGRTNLGRANT